MPFISSLTPKNSEKLEQVIHYIDSQLEIPDEPLFHIDENIASIARNLFSENFLKNQFVSSTARVIGKLGVVGFTASPLLAFYSLPLAGLAALVSAVCIALFVQLRNREGFQLQAALHASTEDEQIRLLSMGANIYQNIRYDHWAVARLFDIPLTQRIDDLSDVLARDGHKKSLSYVLMLEKDSSKRAESATQALSKARDGETAQTLLRFGAEIEGDRQLRAACRDRNLELIKFLVGRGVKIDSGIEDYQEWQNKLEKRPSRIGASFSRTPLEVLIDPSDSLEYLMIDDAPEIAAVEPRQALEALGVDPSVYTDKADAEELFHSLNQAGARISLEKTQLLFEKLKS